MAGLTPAGFDNKRLPEIITDLKEQAVPVFQDLVTDPNDVVDTSDSSNIGRLINLVSPSIAELWEVAQGVYSSSDPNSAEGIPLRNLGKLVNILPQDATPSSVPLLLTLQAAGTAPQGSIARATDTGTEWQLNNSVSANISNYASAITLIPNAAPAPDTYTISYRVGTSTSTITYSSPGGQTAREVAEGIKMVVDSVHTTITASLIGSSLTLTRVQILNPAVFTPSANLTLSEMRMPVTATCTEVGPLRQEPNTITRISTPSLGWLSVTNPVAATPGREAETDEQLRDRILTSRSTRASSLWDSLYSALRNLEGVFSVNIEENDTGVIVAGVPPYSYVAVVSGGQDNDIAQQIWINKPLGISPSGNTSGVAKDIRGGNRTVKFSRPVSVPIYITITIVQDSDIFPGDGVDRIKQSILDYATQAYQIGDDVIYSRLFNPINSVQGHYVQEMFIGTSPSPITSTNIVIEYDQIAAFSSDNIIINTM